MKDYIEALDNIMRKVANDQKEHLEKTVKNEMIKSIAESGKFDDLFLSATREINNIILQAKVDVHQQIEQFNNKLQNNESTRR